VIFNPSHNSNRYFIFLAGFFLVSLAIAVFTSLYWLVAIPFAGLFSYFGWQQWQFVFFFLIFSLPWSVEYSFSSSLATDLPDESLMLLMTALFIAYLSFKPSQVSYSWKHPLVFLLFIYFGWIIITVPFSTDWLLSIKFLLAKGWYLAAFVFAPLIIFRNKKSIQVTGLIFLISMLLLIVLALCRHFIFGFSFANINNAVRPFFRNHVNYSAMLVCTFPILIATYQLNKKYRLAIVLAIIIVLVALFFSYARGAWVALIVGLVSYWLIYKRRLFFAFVCSVLFIIGSVFWIKSNDRYLQYAHDYRTTIFHTNFQEHLVATYKLKDVSTAERFNRWIAGVRMIKDNWLTGYGPNTFYYNYKPYAIPAFKTWVSDNKEHSTVHNYFLLVIIEQGIPGLLFFLLLVGGMLSYSETLYKRIQDRFYKAAAMACGVMVVMIIVVNFLSDLIETDKIGSLFFLCLATLVAIDINTRSEIKNESCIIVE
jgi:O-antigen ligase